MRRSIFALLFIASTAVAAEPFNLYPPAPEPAGRVIVEFRSAPAAATFAQFHRDVASIDTRSGKKAIQDIRYEYVQAMFGAAVEMPDAMIEQVRRLPYVKAVHRDHVVHAFDSGDGSVVAAEVVDAAARVNAGSLGTRGEGVTVGVIDSGIDYRHPALGGGFGAGHKVAGGWDFANNDADPMDDFGHGTHVAGIIGADSSDLLGVAPGVTLIAYKVLNAQGAGMVSDIIAAIDRSIDPNGDGDTSDHLDVINLSLGGAGNADDPGSLAVDRATAAGITVVVAAGNESGAYSVRSPGTARTAITVAALNAAGGVSSYSSRGPAPKLLSFKPDVAAPGDNIVSANLGGGLIAHSGTSMATPHVAGVAALLRKLHPDWKPADIRGAIITMATPKADPPAARGAGRVDAAHAAAATMLPDSSGLSFGLAFGTTGAWEQTRIVNLANHSAVARTLTTAPASAPSGATITATPATVQLAPGATQAVELKLALDNAAVAFPADPVLSGTIAFSGDGGFTLPWIVMRAARFTVSFDVVASHVSALSANGTALLLPYDDGKAEMFGAPGSTWDLLMPGYEPGDDLGAVLRLVTLDGQVMKGDDALELHKSVASVELLLDARDETGRLFSDDARDRGNTGRW